jgi:hypothetical protein
MRKKYIVIVKSCLLSHFFGQNLADAEVGGPTTRSSRPYR